MTLTSVLVRNLRYFWRQHLGVIAGTAICSMVLVGAMMVGDSVKETLRRIAEQRIGKADLALLAEDGFFREELANTLAPKLGEGAVVAPIVVTRGNVTSPDGSVNVKNVQVLGVDERFWKLAPDPSETPDSSGDDFFANERLYRHLKIQDGERIVLRVEEPSLFSRDAPLSGERDNKFVSLNKTLGGFVSKEGFGRFGLLGNQREPLTLFVPLETLQKRLFRNFDEQNFETAFANFLLLGSPGGSMLSMEKAESALNDSWTLADAGISVKELRDTPAWTVRSRQVFLNDSLVKAGRKAVGNSAGVLTYLVNAIYLGEDEKNASALIPYSMVSATDPKKTDLLPDDFADDEIALNHWAANDLNATEGSIISLSYFAVGERRKLREESRTFRVRLVTPLPPKVPDDEESDWTPQFPGLSDAESCGEWDTGIPIKHEVRDKDEEYWDEHRGSPKAFVALSAGQSMWGNRWGSLTGLRINKADVSREDLEKSLRSGLTASEAGLLFRPLRIDASDAAESPIDFGQLFMGFSFFVIVAAMSLTGMLFAFAMEQRNRQAGLLLAVGIPAKKVRRLFLAEGLILSLAGALCGILLATYYGKGILNLLSGQWSGAVAGASFDFSSNPTSNVIGMFGAMAMATLAMWWATRRQLSAEPTKLLAMGETFSTGARGRSFVSEKLSFAIAGVLFAVALGLAFLTDLSGPGASMIFFGAGWCLLAGGLLVFQSRLARSAGSSGEFLDAASFSRRNAARRSGRSIVTAGAIAAGAFLVVGTGAFRKEVSTSLEQPSSGTGGFAFFGESALPVYDDLNGGEGRELFDLNGTLLADSTIVPLRVREGDDASCLNLNKALRPRLYGVKPSDLEDRFTFAEGNWSSLLETEKDGVIPAAVDQNTMMWALKKGVGDLIEYRDGEGRPFQVKLAAVLKGSMLQGALYVDERHFEEKFPKQGGYRGFFVDVPHVKADAVFDNLTDRLSNYGLDLRPSVERLAELQEVENTYIAIFQFLGGLGLLLGTAGLAVGVARNLLERSKEIGLLEAVGFALPRLRKLATTEHLGLAFWGLGIGVSSAVLGISPALFGEIGQPPGTNFVWLLVGLIVLSLFWTWLAVTLSLQTSRLSALRDE